MANPGLLGQIASQGRRGDTELAHVNPQEKALLKALGGSGTINPATGLREYGHAWYHPQWVEDVTDYAQDHLFGSGTSTGENPIFGQTSLYEQLGDYVDDLSSGQAAADIWDATLGNEGIGGWAADRIGLHGKPEFMGGEGVYWGAHPGDDETWDADMAGKSEMLKSLADLQKIYDVNKRDFGIKKEFQTEKKKMFHEDALSRYIPQKKTEAFTQGKLGTGVKFGSGTNIPDIASQYTAEKEQGLLGLREEDWKQKQGFQASEFDIQTAGRNIYMQWFSSITSPEYKAQAQSWDDVSKDMPWLQGGSTTSSYG